MKLIEIFEEQVRQEREEDRLFEMARIGPKYHGIPHVVIWVGQTNKRHGLRVKVSNIKDKFDIDDNFVIMMPSLDYNPKSIAKWITPTTMRQIIDWIKLNQQVLFDYENGAIVYTDDFLEMLSKV